MRGFILQSDWRIERGRPVVRLWGRLEDGRSFLARDGETRPRFWIRAADAARARAIGAPVEEQGEARRTLDGAPAVAVAVARPQEARTWLERLESAGIATYEADLPLDLRRRIDLGLRGGVAIEGEGRPGERVGLVFDDPRLAPADWAPRLRPLSFDIETDPRATRLLAIALAGCGTEEVLLVGPGASERDVLARFVARVAELDPDLLTGWNVVDFDLAVLARLAARHRVELDLGRERAPLRILTGRGPRGSTGAVVPGRLVLDGLQLVRAAFVRLESYALDAAARAIVGRGKRVAGPGRAAWILEAASTDPEALADYALEDARLVLEILERLGLVELAVERARLTGLTPDRIGASVAAFDALYLGELSRRGIVAPSVAAVPERAEPATGGQVLDPLPGLWENVVVLDFRSLYPSVIRTFEIDPLGRIERPRPGDDPIRAPNGAAFRRQRGILPRLLDELFARREAARRAGDRVASQAIKILMNSFYGVLGTPACRFAHPDLANAITSFGRTILLWCRDRLAARGHRVLYGDTDSLFVLTGAAGADAARAVGLELARSLNVELAAHVEREWRVESRLEAVFERLYLRLFLPPLRHGGGGARKRYAGLAAEADGSTRVVLTGLEAVRSDWTALARETQQELFERLFSDRPIEAWLRERVRRLRAGELDDRLVYRKRLRKELAEYTASTPPHVAAARRAGGGSGRRIAYVITAAGAEPADGRTAPIDHEHYVARQIRPVVEPVLALLGLDFDRVVGDASQLELFP